MKISFQMAMWMCAVFAIVALAFAANGFAALASITDPSERDVASGYAWFWTFLGVVGLVFGALSWAITRGKLGRIDG